MPIRSVAARNEVRRPTPRFSAPGFCFFKKQTIGIREKVHTRVLITSRPTSRRCRVLLFCFCDPPFQVSPESRSSSSLLKATEPPTKNLGASTAQGAGELKNPPASRLDPSASRPGRSTSIRHSFFACLKQQQPPRLCFFALGLGALPTSPMLFSVLLMILPQVHLRKPCYDFYDL